MACSAVSALSGCATRILAWISEILLVWSCS